MREFAQPGDGIVALCPRYDPSAACGLCQRAAIYRCFPIQNTRTGALLMLGVECVQAYRALARKLRRGKENYRDPGTIPTIVKRYWSRGALTEEQVQDLLSAGRVKSGPASSHRQSQSQ
jgi:hypothetical protein